MSRMEEFINEKGKELFDPLKGISSCELVRQNTLPQMTQVWESLSYATDGFKK